jgi:xanthine dehydrogenase accessory factor
MSNFFTKTAELLKEGKTPFLLTILNAPGFPDLTGEKLLYSGDTFFPSNPNLTEYWKDLTEELVFQQYPSILFSKNSAEIFIERLAKNPSLILCGGGHISLPLSKLGHMLGFHVTVIDPREEFANPSRFSENTRILCKEFKPALLSLPPSANNYYVIITRGHSYDQVCLETILNLPGSYTGMIGSENKVRKVMELLKKKGYSKEKLDKVFAPIGLDIAAKTPEEIAVAIMAQIIWKKNTDHNLSYMDDSILQILQSKQKPLALATIIEKKGSAPRGSGTKMLVLNDGSSIGTIGGGAGEYQSILACKKALHSGKSSILTITMQNADAEKEGMICGGTVRVLIDLIR